MQHWEIARRVFFSGCAGALVFLSVNTACNMMQSCGSDNFICWIGTKIHDQVRNYGDKQGERDYPGANGEVNWAMLPPHRKLPYYVVPGMTLAFGIGLMAAGAYEIRRRKFTETAIAESPPTAPSELVISIRWPLALAFFGIFFHGHLLGLAAIVLVGNTKTSRVSAWCARLFGVAVVLLWGIGSELWWGHGWSMYYPALEAFLKRFVDS